MEILPELDANLVASDLPGWRLRFSYLSASKVDTDPFNDDPFIGSRTETDVFETFQIRR